MAWARSHLTAVPRPQPCSHPFPPLLPASLSLSNTLCHFNPSSVVMSFGCPFTWAQAVFSFALSPSGPFINAERAYPPCLECQVLPGSGRDLESVWCMLTLPANLPPRSSFVCEAPQGPCASDQSMASSFHLFLHDSESATGAYWCLSSTLSN